ncbi:hypothetical protein [Muriicola sp.]|uniref:hypothetical protein n=1 Tax=Muriicola sp. TaxID=2020856 RepID=UPI003C735B92
MKNTFFLLLLILSLNTMAQDNAKPAVTTDTFVTTLHITVNSIDELQEVNWADIRQIFAKNEPTSPIELGFSLSKKQVLTNFDLDAFEFKISGKTDELESMILRTQKMIAAIEKIE